MESTQASSRLVTRQAFVTHQVTSDTTPDANRGDVKGCYLLIFRLDAPLRQLTIGRFGSFDFSPGYYLYVGSAMGSGGISARLAYHQRRHKDHPHWHVDYLRPYMGLVEAWTIGTQERLECVWCQSLTRIPVLSTPVLGFGSRDTGCPTHLFYTGQRPGLRMLTSTLLASLSLEQEQEHELRIEISTFDE